MIRIVCAACKVKLTYRLSRIRHRNSVVESKSSRRRVRTRKAYKGRLETLLYVRKVPCKATVLYVACSRTGIIVEATQFEDALARAACEHMVCPPGLPSAPDLRNRPQEPQAAAHSQRSSGAARRHVVIIEETQSASKSRSGKVKPGGTHPRSAA